MDCAIVAGIQAETDIVEYRSVDVAENVDIGTERAAHSPLHGSLRFRQLSGADRWSWE